MDSFMRFRRLRQTEALRSLMSETRLAVTDLVLPVFVQDQSSGRSEINSLPDVYRYGLEDLFAYCEMLCESGIRALALFPVIKEDLKDKQAAEALNSEGLIPKVIRQLKKRFPELVIFADVALDPYSSDGHDGIVKAGKVLNDETVVQLAKMAVVLAESGADFVAPSDMMDGRVVAIRRALDQAGYIDTGIMSYAVKYASSFYGPFRDALQSEPKMGDKKTYQMDPANPREALKEALQDVQEGADILMIKPAGMYLDVVSQIKQRVHCPVAAYHVSGEYAMLKFAAEKGCFNYEDALYEKLLCIKRAGADMIFSYGALEMAEWLGR
ncbi:MAG: porphobilinogen synthase [bacterium]